jgi:hypothetical protein
MLLPGFRNPSFSAGRVLQRVYERAVYQLPTMCFFRFSKAKDERTNIQKQNKRPLERRAWHRAQESARFVAKDSEPGRGPIGKSAGVIGQKKKHSACLFPSSLVGFRTDS